MRQCIIIACMLLVQTASAPAYDFLERDYK